MKRAVSWFVSFVMLFCVITSADLSALSLEGPGEIAMAVMGYNTNPGYNYTASLGSDNSSKGSAYAAYNYDAYVLPISELGLSTGDILVCTNSHPNTDFIYMPMFLNSNWEYLTSGGWGWVSNSSARKITINDDMEYISFYVVKSYGENREFDKKDIPFNDFKFYKNSISNENQLDYLSLWEAMLEYDSNLELDYELWCHNADWDYQDQQRVYSGQSLQKSLEFFDAYDLDLKSTLDGVTVCWYNAAGYDKAGEYTYDELKARNPGLMTFEEMLSYIKDNNKKCFINLNTVERNDLELIQKYEATDRVFSGRSRVYENATSLTGNMYIWCQSSEQYNLD